MTRASVAEGAGLRAGTGTRKDSGYQRVADDWYVEDDRTVRTFFAHKGPILDKEFHDPCCGIGTIPRVGAALGYSMTGADLRDRASGRYEVRDFLTDRRTHRNIVTNPPFNLAVPIVRHALAYCSPGGIVAIVAQAKFLFSQERNALFNLPSMERVLILSKRPSMPPGEMLAAQGEACRKGGFHDFCWIIWRIGKTQAGATIEWVL